MSHRWDHARARYRRSRRRNRADGLDPEEAVAGSARASSGRSRPGRGPLTPEERAYREARRAANRKVAFLAHAVPYAAVCLFLLLVAGFRPAMVVALAWGIGLAVHYFLAIAAPRLRQRFIEREVSQRVQAGVSAERRSLEGQHSQRVEELSASIAHEIRNPITAAKSLLQQMGEDPAAADNVEYATVALQELERVERSISHLLRFAREEDLEMGVLRIGDVVASALETFRERLRSLGVEAAVEVKGALEMRGDAEKLRRVLINLLGNALDAFQEAHTSEPRLQIQAGQNLAGSAVWIRIKDNGPGMDAARLRKIFSPFYTSKEAGTGLGLALSKKVVDAHGGSIEARSEPGRGSEFVLTFPRPSESERAS